MSEAAVVSVRPAVADDRAAILELLALSLGWNRGPEFRDFFDWKHERNAFGQSPGWVAVVEERVVGFRTFLRWEFEHPDGRVRRAVRAVRRERIAAPPASPTRNASRMSVNE